MYGHVITKFSRMGSLPHFFTHGAPCARFALAISDLISVRSKSSYNLRSNSSFLLEPPREKMFSTLGARSFYAAEPCLWNSLPR